MSPPKGSILAASALCLSSLASGFVPAISSSRRAFSSCSRTNMKFEYADEYEKSSKDIKMTKNHTDLMTDGLRIAPPPYSVVGRESGLSGTVLVSGFLQGGDRSDQVVFDMLHTGDGLKYDKIVALCEDDKMAKKRLMSRSARYSGLLDVLSFVQSDSNLPSSGDLQGVGAWVARTTADLSAVKSVAELASAAAVKNLVVLVEGVTNDEDSAAMDAALKATDVDFTLLNFNALVDGPEGETPYRFLNITDSPASLDGTAINKDELARLVAVSLTLDKTLGRSLSVKNVKSTEPGAVWLRALRQKGFSRVQEVDALLGGMVDVPYFLRAQEAQVKFKGLREGSVKLSPEELAIKAASDKREQRRQRIEMMKTQIKERQEDILKRTWKALAVAYNDRKYAGKGGMDEDVFNKQNFDEYILDAISMWDSGVNGKKNRQSYHTDADAIWIPQMLEKYSQKRKKKVPSE